MNPKLNKVPGRKASSMRTAPGRAAVQSVKRLSEVGVSLGGALKKEDDGGKYPDTDRGSVMHMANFLMNDAMGLGDHNLRSCAGGEQFRDMGELSEVKITKMPGTGAAREPAAADGGGDSKRERAATFFSLLRK